MRAMTGKGSSSDSSRAHLLLLGVSVALANLKLSNLSVKLQVAHEVISWRLREAHLEMTTT